MAAPNVKRTGRKGVVDRPPSEEIVISGMSGSFPDTENLLQFQENILNKVDLTSIDDRRWKNEHADIPSRSGKLFSINKFDASFFGITHKKANKLDPMCRMLIEKSYEAIVDAGYNPNELKGSNTGVFIGISMSESEKVYMYDKAKENLVGLLCTKYAFAEYISYCLGLNGPSYGVDTACSSSMSALDNAYQAILQGRCDAALVSGVNLTLNPYITLQFASLGVLSPDGRCKTFDESANGYSRSEAIGVLYLQKAKEARRIYCTVVHVKTNCDGFKEEGITFPSSQMQKQLLTEFYEECGIDPSTVGWIEAHGTGTKVGDPQEVNVLEEVFCEGRKSPLHIGAVKSNIGHSEAASAICSLVKAIISMETGIIPPNINFRTPRHDIEALRNGKISVVLEKTPWNGATVGVNSFGFGGANGHTLLRWNEKTKTINTDKSTDDKLPYVVVASGRTEEAVNAILHSVITYGYDSEHIKLLYEIHKESIPGHYVRGYLLHDFATGSTTKHIQNFEGISKEVWFLFREFNSEEIPVINNQMMQLPGFSNAIQRCHRVLLPCGVNLINEISGNGKKDILNTLVNYLCVASIQIGLIEVLANVGVVPHKLLGFSVGEFVAAYADGVLTLEQAILATYYYGLITASSGCEQKSIVNGGTEWNNDKKDSDFQSNLIQDRIKLSRISHKDSRSDDISLNENCERISNEADNVSNDESETTVNCELSHYLNMVIPRPKLFTNKFVNTKFQECENNNSTDRRCSPEYFEKSFQNSKFSKEVFKSIRNNAVIIDFSLSDCTWSNQDMNSSVAYIPLIYSDQKRESIVSKLFDSFGRLFEEGLNLQYDKLYPTVTFPVSRGTPMISPYILWDHSKDWFTYCYKVMDKIPPAEKTFNISLKEEDQEYLSGHVIDGRNLFPATGYLELVWQLVGYLYGVIPTDLPIVFKNVKFHRATNIPKDGSIDFYTTLQRGSGKFQVVEGGAVTVTGRVYVPSDVEPEMTEQSALVSYPDKCEQLVCTPKDIYKELRLRGYNYKGLFRSLTSVENAGSTGRIAWHNNFVAFMDNMLQMHILNIDARYLIVPTSIDKIVINSKKHFQEISNLTGNVKEVPVTVYNDIKLIKSGGIEVTGLQGTIIPRKKILTDPVLEKYEFVPYSIQNQEMQLYDAVRVCVHLVLENVITTNLKIVEVYENTCDLVAPVLVETVGDLPLLQAQIIVFSDDDSIQPKSGYSVEKKRFTSDVSASLVVVPVDGKDLSQIINCAIELTNKDGFILCRENINKSQRRHTVNVNDFNHGELTLIFEACCDKEKIYLFRKKLEVPALEVIEFNNNDLNWVSELQMVMKNSKKKVLVVSQGDRESGLVGFINCFRKEPNGDIFRCLLIQDEDAPKFSLSDPFYSKQLNKNLVMNVLSNGQWGSYRHLLLKEQQEVLCTYGQIDVMNVGDLSSLAWLQLPLRKHQQEGFESVFVYYSSVNFRDVMVATGRLVKSIEKNIYEQDKIFGVECAGRLADGRRVMGITFKLGFVTQALMNKCCMWEVPDEWSLKEAASVPIVYSTVILAMYVNGRMKKGDTVLIHAGSGGVGLAAITMALYSGCTVFTTVGSLEKRKFLTSQFPQLSDKHIGNSRDTSFEHMVMRETNGRGVDIVLNSLSEEKLLASVRCMAPGGRFLEIGKYDLQSNNSLGMEQFLKMASFHGVMLDTIVFDEAVSKSPVFSYIHSVLADAIKSGAVKPLKTTVFESEDSEQAFRYMASGKHTGKVLIKIREEEPNKLQKPTFIEKLMKPCFSCRQNRTYVIIGGLGGFGLELIDWLIYNGARNLVITSRNGVRTGYQAMRVRAWRKYNVNVEICTLPLVSRDEVKNVLVQANKLAPVGGIFNLAVILRDSLFSNMKVTDFETSLKPKAHVTRLLDEVSRELCPELEQFVVFSSVSCGRGNAGQTNYGMANSIMERICERRRKENLHGLAIQWGAVGDVGLVADMQEENIELVIGGTLQQKIRNCLEVLNTFLYSPHAVVSSMVVAEKRNSHDNSGSIIDTICNILGIRDRKTVSVHSTLAELGMDSMMAVEIKQILEQQFEIFLTSQDIRVLTVAKLQEISKCSDNLDKEQVSGEKAKEILGPAYQYLVTRIFGDEKFADDIVVRLPSLSQGDVLHKNSTIIVLPGVEGLASVLEPFAKNLYWNVFCLQYPSDEISNSSISNLASTLLPEIKKCIRQDEKFMIAGYSFGSLIAMEVTYMLEKEGYSGNLVLIDGSPNYVRSMLLEVFLEGDSSDDKLQRKVLDRAVANVWPSESSEFTEKLNEISDWSERVDLFIDYSNDRVYSKIHQKRTMCAVYSRSKTILSYEGLPEKSIKSPVALLRPTENPTAHVEEDYGLSKYCVEDISVHVVEGNHLTLLENEKIGSILSSITGNKAAPIIYTF